MNGSAMKKANMIWTSLKPIFKKEMLHIVRSPTVIAFAFIFPIFELVLLGYFLDIKVRHIDTVVYDVSASQESRALLRKFSNTDVFRVNKWVQSDDALYSALISGEAKVAIKIPVDYGQRLIDGRTASVLVLVDGSNSTVASEAINVSNSVMLEDSLKRIVANAESNSNLPVETRASVLFNPDTSSPNFFLPGLIVYELSSIIIILVAFSIAGERERGTMDQLSMTPIDSTGMLLGKIFPYGLLAFIQQAGLIIAIHYVFHVPMRGNVLLLMLLSIPFLLTGLGLGLIVSSRANTNMEAMQLGVLVRLVPPLYLSGYIFPIESMPRAFQVFTKFVPDRYYMEIVRGITLRGIGIRELWWHGVVLTIMSIVIFSFAALLYRKKTW